MVEQNFSFSQSTGSNPIPTFSSILSKNNELVNPCTEYFTKDGKKLSPKKPLLNQRFVQQNKQQQIFDDDEPLLSSQFGTIQPEGQQECQIQFATEFEYVSTNEKKFKIMLEIIFPEIKSHKNLDLIFVVDQSSSMKNNGKLQQVQQSIITLLQFLTPADRISLISFSNSATRYCPLIHPTGLSLIHFQNQLLTLQPQGGTQINKGMKLAMQVIKERKEKNQITTIFLFSDGQDENTEQIEDMDILINAFGFGTDHDAQSLLKIIKHSSGRFYYIEETEMIGECFIDALGAAKSVVAADTKIQISLEKGFEIKKKFGEGWEKKGEIWEKQEKYLIGGVTKHFIFEIKVPKFQLKQYEPIMNQTKIEIGKAYFSFFALEQKSHQNFTASLNQFFYNENNGILKENVQKQNKEVLFQWFRVRTAEILNEANLLANKGEYTRAQDLINILLEKKGIFENLKNNQEIELLISDLKKSQQGCVSAEAHQRYGYKFMSNRYESCPMFTHCEGSQVLYQNPVQIKLSQEYRKLLNSISKK